MDSELAPFFLPSNYNFAPGSSNNLLSPGYSTETLGTQTSAYVEDLIEEIVEQESVDMQTQTLEEIGKGILWEFNDADTQTYGMPDFFRMSPEFS